MFRIGMTIRSAKMKAITPPKLMPPFHSTAASGMLPTEQTKEITATSGPTIGPHSAARIPIHHEIVADRGATSVGGHPLPNGAALGDGHIHFGMAFHAARNALVGLFLSFFEKVPA